LEAGLLYQPCSVGRKLYLGLSKEGLLFPQGHTQGVQGRVFWGLTFYPLLCFSTISFNSSMLEFQITGLGARTQNNYCSWYSKGACRAGM